MTQLRQFLNNTLLLASSGVFGDDEPHAGKIIGIDDYGLWLEGEELSKQLNIPPRLREHLASVTVFVPFCQIAYILCPAGTDRTPVAVTRIGIKQFVETPKRGPNPSHPEQRAPKSKDAQKTHKGRSQKGKH